MESKVGVNTAWMTGGTLGRLTVQALLFFLLARLLGADEFGVLSGILAIVFILVPFASWGSGFLLIQNVARDRTSFGPEYGRALLVVTASGLLFTGVGAVVCYALEFGDERFLTVLMLCVSELIFGRYDELAIKAFQGRERLKISAAILVLSVSLRLVALLIAFVSVENVTIDVWAPALMLSGIASSAVSSSLVINLLGSPECAPIRWDDLKFGFYFALGVSSVSVNKDADKAMLLHFDSPAVTASYSVAYRVVDLVFTPIRGLLAATFPRQFVLGGSGLRASMSLTRRYLPFSLAYAAVGSVACWFLAPVVAIVLGAEYSESTEIIRLLSILPVIYAGQLSIANALTGAGLQGYRSACQIGAGLTNVAANAVLIPIYSWYGAVWSTIGSELLLAAAFALIVGMKLRAEISSVEKRPTNE